GTGYYHPVLPLIPTRDREQQVERWLGIGRHLFARQVFCGFWPPEMAFCMELIPLLKRLGYRYVVVDSEHVEPVTPMPWHELRYRPHLARHQGEEIVVVVRDRELSDAQESGMDAGWFIEEVEQRTKWCDHPPLVTTCTDGDNGGWFRETADGANFWTVFHDELLDRVEAGQAGGIRPSFIDTYLDRHGASGEVKVRTGAWNTEWHDGRDFGQWTGSAAQRAALASIAEVSEAVASRMEDDPLATEQALWRLLRAETSCNLYWGEAWVDRCEADLKAARRVLAGLPDRRASTKTCGKTGRRTREQTKASGRSVTGG
ncbi:MAG: hypothetical protein JXA67_02365, partial [Micromonosporaceae bacterium]|nr:hypothetical protein [Micromonosporaceae bacterium]